jgi:phenylacetate-CoA ligase
MAYPSLFSQYFSEIAQRIAYLCKNDKRFFYYDLLRKNLSLSANDIIRIQNDLIQKLVNHAYNNTQYYKKIMDDLNLKPDDIRNKEDLRKLPILTKSIIRNNINKIKSKDHWSKKLKLVTSGGSTGNQAVIYKSPYFEQMSRAAFLRNNLISGWYPGDKSVWIWGVPYEHQQVKESLISKVGIIINKRLLFNAYSYSTNDFGVWTNKIMRSKPKILYGYASIISQYSKYLLRNNISIPCIRKVVTTSEKLEDREIIEKAFHCDVYDQYGCREIFSLGIESHPGIMRIANDVVALNIYEKGEFVITALHSYGFPLINYLIGDYGELLDSGAIKDNLPFSSMNLKIGRMTDNFLTADGFTVSSTALCTYISTFNFNVSEQQIIQNDYKHFVINYVPDSNFELQYYKKNIDTIFEEYFGKELTINFNKVDRVPIEKSGKKLMCKRLFNYD